MYCTVSKQIRGALYKNVAMVELPDDIVRLIFSFVLAERRNNAAATLIQKSFRRYRTKTLFARFRLLQYLWGFYPQASRFLKRVRL